MIDTWLAQFRHYLPRISPARPAPAQQPLISTEELSRLRDLATQSSPSLIRFEQRVSQPRIGDRLSGFRGQGFEFEEHRPYQSGDEQRLINWRLYARRGELYSKVFIEERRPQVHVLVDRRAPMRFGTHVRLKVTLAAQLAVITLLQARQRTIATGGVVIDDLARWFSPSQGESGFAALLDAICAPCPPQSFDREQESLAQVISQLDMRLNEGCFILLLSDFADLDADENAAILSRLGEKHTVQAIQLYDRVETQLPAIQPLLIDVPGTQPLTIDGHQARDDGRYQQAITRQNRILHEGLSRCNIAGYRCETGEAWQDCVRQAAWGGEPRG